MGPVVSTHSTDEALVSYALERLYDTAVEEVSDHLERCVQFLPWLATLSDNSLLAPFRKAKAPHDLGMAPRASGVDIDPLSGQAISNEQPSELSRNAWLPELFNHPAYACFRNSAAAAWESSISRKSSQCSELIDSNPVTNTRKGEFPWRNARAAREQEIARIARERDTCMRVCSLHNTNARGATGRANAPSARVSVKPNRV